MSLPVRPAVLRGPAGRPEPPAWGAVPDFHPEPGPRGGTDSWASKRPRSRKSWGQVLSGLYVQRHTVPAHSDWTVRLLTGPSLGPGPENHLGPSV